MITAGEETELLVGVKNDGKSIKFDTHCCILACSLMLLTLLTVMFVTIQ